MTGGKVVEDKTNDDAAAFGLKPQHKTAAKTEHYEVWDEHWESVMMFMRMSTQWNVVMGGYVGLKYEVLVGAGGLMALYDVENPRQLLEEIQVMEAAALAELNKAKK